MGAFARNAVANSVSSRSTVPPSALTCSKRASTRSHDELEDAPPEEVFPKVELSDEFLHAREPVISGILQTIGKLARSDRSLNDREVISALVNLAKSYQTLVASGLVYEQVSPSLAQQALIETVRQLLQEFRELEREHLGHTTLKDAEVLKRAGAGVAAGAHPHFRTSALARVSGFSARTISRRRHPQSPRRTSPEAESSCHRRPTHS